MSSALGNDFTDTDKLSITLVLNNRFSQKSVACWYFRCEKIFCWSGFMHSSGQHALYALCVWQALFLAACLLIKVVKC